MNRIVVGVAAWLSCGVVAAGGNHAAFYCNFYELSEQKREVRADLTTNLLAGSLGGPIFLVVSAASTGGFQDGLSFSTKERDPWDTEVPMCN